jgi:hypothetical protein
VDGWTARIPTLTLPHCQEPVLTAYGVPPNGKHVWKLKTDVPLPEVSEGSKSFFKSAIRRGCLPQKLLVMLLKSKFELSQE